LSFNKIEGQIERLESWLGKSLIKYLSESSRVRIKNQHQKNEHQKVEHQRNEHQSGGSSLSRRFRTIKYFINKMVEYSISKILRRWKKKRTQTPWSFTDLLPASREWIDNSWYELVTASHLSNSIRWGVFLKSYQVQSFIFLYSVLCLFSSYNIQLS